MRQCGLLIACIIFSSIINIAMAVENNAKSSIGVNYTVAYDSVGTRGGGVGVQYNYILDSTSQFPNAIRVTYMSLSGNYYTGITWSASLIGIGYIIDWKNESKWTPYAGIGIVNVSITSLLNNNMQSSLISPASIVGIKYPLNSSLDFYSEINSIAGTQGITAGMNYKF